jgi:polyisoprenoid-binding protein YceI
MKTWKIDPSHSAVRFSVRHLMISKVHGQFTAWTGDIQLDDADLARSSVKVEIDAASIHTNEEKRDAHLRSADFFDAEQFPKLTFASKSVLAEGGKVTQVIGDLTIHGVTRQVTLDVEDLGRQRDPWGGERVGYEAKTSISRKDFGLHWNVALETGGVLVADKIEITLEIEAVAEAAVAKAS